MEEPVKAKDSERRERLAKDLLATLIEQKRKPRIKRRNKTRYVDRGSKAKEFVTVKRKADS